MLMWMCRFPFWPLGPIAGFHFFAGLVAIAGVVFSLIMLIDCLKRPDSKFYHPIVKGGEYDRLIWAAAIVLSLWFYFIGAIAYFFVVRNAKTENKEQ